MNDRLPPLNALRAFEAVARHLSITKAAISGLGITMTHEIFVLDDLKTGRLVIPFDLKIKMPNDYYLVCPEACLYKTKIKKFRRWLLKESQG